MNSDAEQQPVSGALSGKTAFAAASAKLLPELEAGLRALGADVVPAAVIEAEEIEDNAVLNQAIANIGRYDWIIFTSAWGVSFFAKSLARYANGAAGLPKICVIGPATAAAAENHGFHITLTADEHTAEGVMQSLERFHCGVNNLRGLSVLIPRALEAREFLPAELTAAGCRVDAISCYKTVLPTPDEELYARLRKETPDLIVFTSSKAMRNFLKTARAAVGENGARRFLNKTVAAVIGPVTAKALESEGKTPEIIPAESAVPALLAAIEDYYKPFAPISRRKNIPSK